MMVLTIRRGKIASKPFSNSKDYGSVTLYVTLYQNSDLSLHTQSLALCSPCSIFICKPLCYFSVTFLFPVLTLTYPFVPSWNSTSDPDPRLPHSSCIPRSTLTVNSIAPSWTYSFPLTALTSLHCFSSYKASHQCKVESV